MGKINLAKQNQYVEFAEKDDKGNNISEALKTIGEAIDGKIGFDADVNVEYNGTAYIAGSDVDLGVGAKLIRIHNLFNGIASVRRQSGSTDYDIWAMDFKDGSVYTGSGPATGNITLTPLTKPTFDGTVPVTTVMGNKGIEASNWPTASGVYKLTGSRGIMFYDYSGPYSPLKAFIFVYLTSEQYTGLKMYEVSITPQSSFSFIANNESGSTNFIYYHPVEISIGSEGSITGIVNLVILDNSKTAYTNNTFLTKVKQLMDNGALINANGYIIGGDNKYYNIFKMTKTDTYRFFGNSTDSTTSFAFSSYENVMSVTDGVNRIN